MLAVRATKCGANLCDATRHPCHGTLWSNTLDLGKRYTSAVWHWARASSRNTRNAFREKDFLLTLNTHTQTQPLTQIMWLYVLLLLICAALWLLAAFLRNLQSQASAHVASDEELERRYRAELKALRNTGARALTL